MHKLVLFGIIIVLGMLAWLEHKNAKRHDEVVNMLYSDVIKNEARVNTSDIGMYGVVTIVAVVLLVAGAMYSMYSMRVMRAY